LQGKALEENNAILAETLACSIHGRAKDLPAPMYHFKINAENMKNMSGSRGVVIVIIKGSKNDVNDMCTSRSPTKWT
jgi:hypothetical protein